MSFDKTQISTTTLFNVRCEGSQEKSVNFAVELKKLFRQGFPDEDPKSVVVKQQQIYFHFVLDSGAAKCGGLWGGRKVVWR